MQPKGTNDFGVTKEPVSSGREVLNSLSEDELLKLIDRLKLLGLKRYYGKIDHENWAMEAVKAALHGKEGWDSRFSPFTNLAWIMRRLAHDHLEKEKGTVSLESVSESAPDGLIVADCLVDHSNPATIHEAAETKRVLRRLIDQASSGDLPLRQIISLALNAEKWQPRVFASDLQIDVREIHNAKKRMQRRLLSLHYEP